jgi:hypothetical protein
VGETHGKLVGLFTSIAIVGATLTHRFAVPPLPKGEGSFALLRPLPMGEGGPLPAVSPAGAGRVRVGSRL